MPFPSNIPSTSVNLQPSYPIHSPDGRPLPLQRNGIPPGVTEYYSKIFDEAAQERLAQERKEEMERMLKGEPPLVRKSGGRRRRIAPVETDKKKDIFGATPLDRLFHHIETPEFQSPPSKKSNLHVEVDQVINLEEPEQLSQPMLLQKLLTAPLPESHVAPNPKTLQEVQDAQQNAPGTSLEGQSIQELLQKIMANQQVALDALSSQKLVQKPQIDPAIGIPLQAPSIHELLQNVLPEQPVMQGSQEPPSLLQQLPGASLSNPTLQDFIQKIMPEVGSLSSQPLKEVQDPQNSLLEQLQSILQSNSASTNLPIQHLLNQQLTQATPFQAPLQGLQQPSTSTIQPDPDTNPYLAAVQQLLEQKAKEYSASLYRKKLALFLGLPPKYSNFDGRMGAVLFKAFHIIPVDFSVHHPEDFTHFEKWIVANIDFHHEMVKIDERKRKLKGEPEKVAKQNVKILRRLEHYKKMLVPPFDGHLKFTQEVLMFLVSPLEEQHKALKEGLQPLVPHPIGTIDSTQLAAILEAYKEKPEEARDSWIASQLVGGSTELDPCQPSTSAAGAMNGEQQSTSSSSSGIQTPSLIPASTFLQVAGFPMLTTSPGLSYNSAFSPTISGMKANLFGSPTFPIPTLSSVTSTLSPFPFAQPFSFPWTPIGMENAPIDVVMDPAKRMYFLNSLAMMTLQEMAKAREEEKMKKLEIQLAQISDQNRQKGIELKKHAEERGAYGPEIRKLYDECEHFEDLMNGIKSEIDATQESINAALLNWGQAREDAIRIIVTASSPTTPVLTVSLTSSPVCRTFSSPIERGVLVSKQGSEVAKKEEIRAQNHLSVSEESPLQVPQEEANGGLVDENERIIVTDDAEILANPAASIQEHQELVQAVVEEEVMIPVTQTENVDGNTTEPESIQIQAPSVKGNQETQELVRAVVEEEVIIPVVESGIVVHSTVRIQENQQLVGDVRDNQEVARVTGETEFADSSESNQVSKDKIQEEIVAQQVMTQETNEVQTNDSSNANPVLENTMEGEVTQEEPVQKEERQSEEPLSISTGSPKLCRSSVSSPLSHQVNSIDSKESNGSERDSSPSEGELKQELNEFIVPERSFPYRYYSPPGSPVYELPNCPETGGDVYGGTMIATDEELGLIQYPSRLNWHEGKITYLCKRYTPEPVYYPDNEYEEKNSSPVFQDDSSSISTTHVIKDASSDVDSISSRDSSPTPQPANLKRSLSESCRSKLVIRVSRDIVNEGIRKEREQQQQKRKMSEEEQVVVPKKVGRRRKTTQEMSSSSSTSTSSRVGRTCQSGHFRDDYLYFGGRKV